MNENNNKTLQRTSFFMVLLLVVGVALDIVYMVHPFFRAKENALWGALCISCGVEFTVIGFFGALYCIDKFRRSEKRRRVRRRSDDFVNGAYVPVQETSNHVTVGNYQTAEEKFAQIAKMDKTQFVIYVARLFSNRGYQVKLTPVTENHDIDMLVEKMGQITAVGCIISNRVLDRDDIVRVYNGRRYYNVSGCMVLTNMYFDRTAVEFAQMERVFLVDRNVLISQFMS